MAWSLEPEITTEEVGTPSLGASVFVPSAAGVDVEGTPSLSSDDQQTPDPSTLVPDVATPQGPGE